ncbi:hypothetical protein FFA01_30590 [Frigoribacterium faeni]|uniref:Uncharacterized protein n=1 Tax=Frigoribacterium faeni TaxID=145483 RepID=A0ABQ0UTH6_9MICO|nr:hypothetical protein FFA01_30590 [Frigoribacterium faeni]
MDVVGTPGVLDRGGLVSALTWDTMRARYSRLDAGARPLSPLRSRRVAAGAPHRVVPTAPLRSAPPRTASRPPHRVPCTAPRLVPVRCTKRGAFAPRCAARAAP